MPAPQPLFGNNDSRRRAPECIALPGWLTAAFLLLLAVPVLAVAGGDDRWHAEPSRQLALSIQPEQLVASNARLSRMDAVTLEPDERLVQSAVANAVIVAVTNRRVLGYGPVVGWRELLLVPGEALLALEAQGYAAFITTRLRLVNFNADTGAWAESPTGAWAESPRPTP